MKRAGFLALAVVFAAAISVGLSGCGNSSSGGLPPSSGGGGGGGGGTGGTGGNVTPIAVEQGPGGSSFVNTPFVTVRVCVPGSTTNCQNVKDVLLDTGSYGLRLLSSQVGISLPETTDSSGNTLAECTQFEGSYVWGSVATADVYMGGANNTGEVATSVPIQLIGSSSIPGAPSSCTSSGLPANDTVATLGANGILGVGLFVHDCGAACDPSSTSPPNPQPYYLCSSSSCTQTPLAESNQVQNPVALFANDNNGVVVKMNSVSDSGAITATGSLIFGIGTESNNGLGSATVLTVNGFGDISTTYNGVTYSDPTSGTSTNAGSFFDTGSNGLFILDATTLGNGISDCPTGSTSVGPSYYCPSNPVSLTATNVSAGTGGATAAAPFTIANANTLLGNANNFAFDNLGGAFGSGTEAFDWGLPFFFGRTIYFAINGATTPQGSGPYYAY
jgi:hypothetical protein